MSKDLNRDDLGNRMKDYERSTKHILPRRSYTIIRVDGMCFHTFCKPFEKPFDNGFVDAMEKTALYLCRNIMGAQFAFVQSDEISILLTDFSKIGTDAWFGNNLQKMCSASASKATSEFNRQMLIRKMEKSSSFDVPSLIDHKAGEFDSRVYQIPQRTEVLNYFIWRQKDTIRNSISSLAHSLYSQSALHGKTSPEQQELIFQKGLNWNDLPVGLKQGRIICQTIENNYPKWEINPAPDFLKADGKQFFSSLVKENEIIREGV